MDAKERLVTHLVERAVKFYCKLLDICPERHFESEEALEPEYWSYDHWAEKHPRTHRGWEISGRLPTVSQEDELSLDETATRVYLFERYGLRRGGRLRILA